MDTFRCEKTALEETWEQKMDNGILLDHIRRRGLGQQQDNLESKVKPISRTSYKVTGPVRDDSTAPVRCTASEGRAVCEHTQSVVLL